MEFDFSLENSLITKSGFSFNLVSSKFNNSTTLILANIVKENKLFENTGELKFLINDIINNHVNLKNVNISVAFSSNIPIGVSIKFKHRILCFVSLTYRRKGIGSSLVSSLKTENTFAKKGFSGSLEFWNSLKIPVF
jgi:hypothetical protein